MRSRTGLRVLTYAALTAVLASVRGGAAAWQERSVSADVLDSDTLLYGDRVFVAVDAGLMDASHGEPLARRFLMSDGDEGHGERLPLLSPEWWLYVVCAISCVITAAFAAGLTMGLVALDPMQLQITLHMDPKDCRSADERRALVKDQECAERVYPIIENHHLLLVTLLLVNAGANEALPVFLDSLLPSWAAILVSVTFVLIFGEIIPSAVFTGPNQLRIAASLSPLVLVLIAVCSPVAYPISLLLDHMLGDTHAGSTFKRPELRAIMKMQREGPPARTGPSSLRQVLGVGGSGSSGTEAAPGAGGSGSGPNTTNCLVSQSTDGTTDVSHALSDDELMIINGVLDIRSKSVMDAMIPLSCTFMLSTDDVLDADKMARLVAAGHSRVPVYRGWPHNVCGLILVKKLIVLSPEDKRKVSSLGLRYPLPVPPHMPLLELLNEFQQGMSHMAIVTNQPAVVAHCMRNGTDIPPNVHMDGIVTLEDILEQIIAEGISDETDDGVAKALTSAARLRERVRQVKILADKLRTTAQPVAAIKRQTTASVISEALRRSVDNATDRSRRSKGRIPRVGSRSAQCESAWSRSNSEAGGMDNPKFHGDLPHFHHGASPAQVREILDMQRGSSSTGSSRRMSHDTAGSTTLERGRTVAFADDPDPRARSLTPSMPRAPSAIGRQYSGPSDGLREPLLDSAGAGGPGVVREEGGEADA